MTREDTIRLLQQQISKSPVVGSHADEACLRHAAHFCLSLGHLNREYLMGNQKEALRQFDAERIHIYDAWNWSAQSMFSLKNAYRFRAAIICAHIPRLGSHILNIRQSPAQRAEWLAIAVTAAELVHDPYTAGIHLGNLGLAHLDCGKPQVAIEHFQKALALHTATGHDLDVGNHLSNIGMVHHYKGEYSTAIEYYERALNMRRKVNDRRGEGTDLGNLCNTYRETGELEKAIICGMGALHIAREMKDKRLEGFRLSSVGACLKKKGEFQLAHEHITSALAISRELGDRKAEGARLRMLSEVQAELGEADLAKDLVEKAIAIHREVSDVFGEAEGMSLLGDLQSLRGDAISSALSFEGAARLRANIEDQKGEATDQFKCALELIKLTRNKAAVVMLHAAISTFERLGDEKANAARTALNEILE